MARKVKCPECGTFNDKECAAQQNGRYYCKVCLENKSQYALDYKNLVGYICEIYDIDVPSGWILKQIKDFKEQYKYTYKGMKTTLHYFYEILEGNDTSDSLGIGIIPFVYDEAKKFYIDKKNVRNSVVDVDVNEMSENKKIINVPSRQLKNLDNQYRGVSLINIENL